MQLREAQTLARELMSEYGLTDWRVVMDTRSRRRFGACCYGTRTIKLATALVAINDRARVENTIRHEIAHALTPGAGHSRAWRMKCYEVGARPEACYDANEYATPEAPYALVCTKCGNSVKRYRRTRKLYSCRRDNAPMVLRRVA